MPRLVLTYAASHLNLEAFSLFSGNQALRLLVTDDLLGLGIPLDFAIQSSGDAGEMTGG